MQTLLRDKNVAVTCVFFLAKFGTCFKYICSSYAKLPEFDVRYTIYDVMWRAVLLQKNRC